jgi:hypothetical protein
LSYRIEQAGKVVKCPACSTLVQLPAVPVAPTSGPPAVAAAEGDLEKASPGHELQLEDDLPARPSAVPREPAPAAAPEREYALSAPMSRAPAPPRTDTSTAAQAAPADLPAKDSAMAEGSFWQALRGAFRYPLEEDGIVALAIGMMLIIVGHYVAYFASFLPIVSLLVPFVVYAVLAGYFTGYAMSLVESSARGEAEPPNLPRIDEYEDAVLRPLRIVVTLGALTVGPYFLYDTWVRDPDFWIGWVLLLPGLSYLPMGLLRVSLDNSISGLNPVPGVRAIKKVQREYLVIWGLVMLVAVLEVIGGWAMRNYLHAFVAGFVGFVLQQTIAFYLLFVAARLTGLLYFTSRDRLNRPAR